ncbi:MAG: bifunctional diaminohydroxyphosphoribosylaminopyrimidine deaminase/5-amino-6-(5-phosphoribosylamino)uracil reductase RibD [Acidiferrobacterales bacterium]
MNEQGADMAHMARALRLARRGLYTTDPNPRVGCVLVQRGEVVGTGWHERAGEPHAEIHALRAAGQSARDATAYVTLEPCCHHGRTPPCTDALIGAKVARVVVAMEDPNPQVAGGGVALLREAGITVEVGLLQAQGEALNPGLISRIRRRRPFVRAKLAASLDGRTAMPSGESRWISGDAARADVQGWRARSSAIVSGVGTILADDPALTVRAFDIGRQPLRVIVDSKLRMPPSAKVLANEGPVLVVTACNDGDRAEFVRNAGAEVLHLPADDDSVDLAALMQHLAGQGINEVLLEAGEKLCGAMLQANLIDEFILYLAPTIMGSRARGMFDVPGLERMRDRVALGIEDVRAIGDDWRFICRPIRD